MRLIFLVAILLVVASCSETPAASTSVTSTSSTTTADPVVSTTSTTATPTTQVPEEPTTVAPSIPPSVKDTFEVVLMNIVGGERLIALADTPELRQQGLMFVDDMVDLDGMLFVFDQDSTGGFWMKNTLIHLDIAFFDKEGVFVDGFEMEPCVTTDCPSYKPSGPYRYALEMAAGTMPAEVTGLGLDR